MSSSAADSAPQGSDRSRQRPSDRQGPAVSGLQVALWLLVSLLVLAVIGWATFDADAFGKLARNLQPSLLVGAVAMTLARIGFGGWRLSYVSRGRLGLSSGIRGQLAWYFFANVTPTVIGGAPPATVYVAYDDDLSLGRSAAIMLFCMLLNQLWFVVAIPLLVGASVAVDVFPAAGGAFGYWSILVCFAGLFLWGLAFAYFTLVRPRRLVELGDWFLRWPLLRRFRDRGMQELRSYFRSARRLRTRSASFFVRSFLLTAPVWLARYAVVVFVVESVYSVERLLLFLRSAAMLLVGLVMPTPGGSGGLEGLYVIFVGPLIQETLVAPTLLAWRLLDYYLFLALGAYLVLYQLRPGERLGTPTAGD